MEKIKVVEKRVKFSSLEQIVKLQFVLHCFAEGTHLTPGDFGLLTHIAIHGYDKKKTPSDLVESRIFLHRQSVRNSRNKLVREGYLIEKENSYRINPDMKIEGSGIIMVDLKAINL